MSDNKNKPGQSKTGTVHRDKSSDGRIILDEFRHRQPQTISESRPAPSRPQKEPSSPSKKEND